MDLTLLLLYSFIIMDVVVVELCIGLGNSCPQLSILSLARLPFPGVKHLLWFFPLSSVRMSWLDVTAFHSSVKSI
jgi:hypothetical protein